MFLWLCLHTSVPVKSVLAARGINCDGKCPVCKRHDETIAHLLHDCDLARKYWSYVEVPPTLVHTFSGSKAGDGGIIKDSQGAWVRGYARSIGFTSSIIVELWALRDGLKLADLMGSREPEVELDAKVIVGLLNSNKNPNFAYAPLPSDYKYLLGKLPQIRVSHMFREANKCVDWLAKWDNVMKEDFIVFEFPFAANLETLVAKNNNGLYYARLVTASMAAVTV
nr:putative ribonuclease h protein [Quercus suber]